MKIGVFMWFNKHCDEFGEINYLINKKYCDKHNYKIIKCNKSRVNSFGLVGFFERYALLYEYMEKDYDYLVWIDADAFFYIDSPPLTNFINFYKNKDFILSGDYDRYNNDHKNNLEHKDINSGFFIVKNNLYVKKILYELYTNKEWYNNKIGCWHDQAVLRYIYINNLENFKAHSIIISYPILMHFPQLDPYYKPLSLEIYKKHILPHYSIFNMNKPLINHYVGGEIYERKKNSMKYLNDISLVS